MTLETSLDTSMPSSAAALTPQRPNAWSPLLKVRRIYLEREVPLFKRGLEILERFPSAERIEVRSHWDIPELFGNEQRIPPLTPVPLCFKDVGFLSLTSQVICVHQRRSAVNGFAVLRSSALDFAFRSPNHPITRSPDVTADKPPPGHAVPCSSLSCPRDMPARPGQWPS